METYKVIGIQHKVGTYNNQPFDNMVYSVVVPADTNKGEVGEIASLIKIKTSLLMGILPSVGDSIRVYYDRFARVSAIEIT